MYATVTEMVGSENDSDRDRMLRSQLDYMLMELQHHLPHGQSLYDYVRDVWSRPQVVRSEVAFYRSDREGLVVHLRVNSKSSHSEPIF